MPGDKYKMYTCDATLEGHLAAIGFMTEQGRRILITEVPNDNEVVTLGEAARAQRRQPMIRAGLKPRASSKKR